MSDLSRVPVVPTSISLDEDIFLRIFPMLQTGTLFRLISTCRCLLYAGLPTLLSRPFLLYSNSNDPATPTRLRSFYDFLSFFGPKSFLCLESLKFSGPLKSAEFDIMADILKFAINLRSLEIDSCNTEFPDSSYSVLDRREEIIRSICSMTNLRNLVFEWEDPDFCHFILKRLHAPLARLILEVDDNSTSPLPLLSNFQDTLEDVYLQFFTIVELPFSCLKLTRMSLQYCSDPPLSVLMNAFPNLEVLSLNTGSGSTPFGLPEHEQLRTQNLEVQTRQQWRSLVSLMVDEIGLYTMALQRELDSLVLPGDLTYSDDLDYSWLQISLLSLRPRHLQVSCRGETVGLSQALSVGMERLNRLDLHIQSPKGSDFRDIIDGMLAALRSLQIHMLYCYIRVDRDDRRTLDQLANDFPATRIARQAMEAAPTLSSIKLISNIWSDSPTYWSATGSGEKKELCAVVPSADVSRFLNRAFLPPQTQSDNYTLYRWPMD